MRKIDIEHLVDYKEDDIERTISAVIGALAIKEE